MSNATNIIKMYLSYECWRKNSSAATEIVRLCIQLNIPLTENENNIFLNLLLGRSSAAAATSKSLNEEEKKSQDDDKKKTKSDITKYKFKF